MVFQPERLFDGIEQRTLWLSNAMVAELLTPEVAYAAVSTGLEAHARGNCIQPLKPYMRPKGRADEYIGGRFITMPAVIKAPINKAGVKFIAGFPANIENGLPRSSGYLGLSSLETGRPLALMECGVLSAARTGAVAAIAFDLLAPSNERRVAVLGAGDISHAVLESLGSAHRDIAEVRIYDPLQQRAATIQERFGGHWRTVCSESAESCVCGSNVIITATTGAKGYLKKDWLQLGSLVLPLSLDDCEAEVLLSADKLVVDDFDQCNREQKLLHKLVESGEMSCRDVHAELGEIVAGIKPGRESDDELVYANLMGMAVEDVAIAAAVYDQAVRHGAGDLLTSTASNLATQ